MIAVRLYSRAHVKRTLTKLGCEPTGEVLQTAEQWRTRGGHHFFVPTEGPDKRCDEYTLGAIVAELMDLDE
jgi:hypothetical protein